MERRNRLAVEDFSLRFPRVVVEARQPWASSHSPVGQGTIRDGLCDFVVRVSQSRLRHGNSIMLARFLTALAFLVAAALLFVNALE